MSHFDADKAILAAEQEQKKEPKSFSFRKQKFTLPKDIPYFTALSATRGDQEDFLRELLGEKQLQKLKSLKPTISEIAVIFEGIAKLYGFESVGE